MLDKLENKVEQADLEEILEKVDLIKQEINHYLELSDEIVVIKKVMTDFKYDVNSELNTKASLKDFERMQAFLNKKANFDQFQKELTNHKKELQGEISIIKSDIDYTRKTLGETEKNRTQSSGF